MVITNQAACAVQKTASEEGWDSMVTEMEKVRDAFVHAFHYFKSQV